MTREKIISYLESLLVRCDFEDMYGDPIDSEPYEEAVEEAIDIIRDAVQVVRCKECKHKPTGTGEDHDVEFPEGDYTCPCRCEDYWYSWMPKDNWFCANGEVKEE